VPKEGDIVGRGKEKKSAKRSRKGSTTVRVGGRDVDAGGIRKNERIRKQSIKGRKSEGKIRKSKKGSAEREFVGNRTKGKEKDRKKD